jgi:hypothetical protein
MRNEKKLMDCHEGSKLTQAIQALALDHELSRRLSAQARIRW